MGKSWIWLLGGGLAGAAWHWMSGSPSPQRAPTPEEPESDQPDKAERAHLQQWEAQLREREQQLLVQEQALVEKLDRLAGLSREQALEQLLQEVRSRHHLEIEAVTRQHWEQLASGQISQAMQRLVVQTVGEHSLSSLPLPQEDYKGRIIGKEGRNLRLFESLTGVDVVIDDTPASVSLSCFDPWRREIARLALERLIQDGRFQPQRIEEAVARARTEMEAVLLDKGRQAAQAVGVGGLHREILQGLGRLAFRTSYRQNVLEHSQEVAWLCAHLAHELGANPDLCKRAGLLHDIGKGLVGQSGPHAMLGGEFCRRWGESEAVGHAVEAHHEDVPQRTLEATLVQVADAISAARPGARRENTQDYLQRLELLERCGRQVSGVVDCQVVQAGREIRVFVRPDSADDEECVHLAQKLAGQIKSELTHPGPVRVTIVRHFQTSTQTG